MPIQIQGNGGVVEVGGTGLRALHVTLRPLEYGALGTYDYAHLSSTMSAGLGKNSEIFQFRWTERVRFACIQLVQLTGMAGGTVAFTAGGGPSFAKVDLLIVRAWSTVGTGGTAATLTGDNSKLRTSMGTMLANDIRGASTVTLGTGAAIMDTNLIGLASWAIGTVANVIYVQNAISLFDAAHLGHPVIFQGSARGRAGTLNEFNGEGLVARASVPATGTWQFGMRIVWSEVAEF